MLSPRFWPWHIPSCSEIAPWGAWKDFLISVAKILPWHVNCLYRAEFPARDVCIQCCRHLLSRYLVIGCWRAFHTHEFILYICKDPMHVVISSNLQKSTEAIFNSARGLPRVQHKFCTLFINIVKHDASCLHMLTYIKQLFWRCSTIKRLIPTWSW